LGLAFHGLIHRGALKTIPDIASVPRKHIDSTAMFKIKEDEFSD
jgi:hypothetical protein